MAVNFDWLAPHYWWIETAMFGRNLQICRTAMLPQVRHCRRVLIVGEGDGRFLVEFLRQNPEASVDVCDLSPTMLRIARRRASPTATVRFFPLNIESDPLPDSGYDLIVTNFLLDCFAAEPLETVVAKLAKVLTPGGLWIIGDFGWPTREPLRRRAAFQLGVMYASFRLATGLTTAKLVDPAPILESHHLKCLARKSWQNGFITSQVLQQPEFPQISPSESTREKFC